MARNQIPNREPHGEPFRGFLLLADGAYLLATAGAAEVNIVAEGDLMIRYGVRFLEKHHRSIVPGLLALDYGDILTGERAWEFIYRRGERYPRADVIGYTDLGEDEMLPLKVLDIDVAPQVLAYADADAIKPLGAVSAVIAPDDFTLPPRLAEVLPRYKTLDAWRTASTFTNDNDAEGSTS